MKKGIAFFLVCMMLFTCTSASASSFSPAEVCAAYNDHCYDFWRILTSGSDISDNTNRSMAAACRLSPDSSYTTSDCTGYVNGEGGFHLSVANDGSEFIFWTDNDSELSNIPLFSISLMLPALDPSVSAGELLPYINEAENGKALTTGCFVLTMIDLPKACRILYVKVIR